MTVHELIEYLEKCDQDQECYIGANETFYEIDYVDNLYDGFGMPEIEYGTAGVCYEFIPEWEKQEEEWLNVNKRRSWQIS